MSGFKILITGNAGSGKSTLSKLIESKRQIPRYSLDSIVWQSGWRKTPDQEKNEKINIILNSNSWVIDGISKQVFLAAERVYFLDIPPWRCLINIIRRFAFNGIATREDLPKNCPEYVGVFKAIRIVFLYQK